MKNILCIETATETCSVCLAQNRKVLASRSSHVNKSHAALLTIFIQEVLEEAGIKPIDINAVAVSMGPGSFTGLRIGVSTAKGIVYGTNASLIAVNTLESMARGILLNKKIQKLKNSSLILGPMIDARRMEVYTGLFKQSGELIREVSAEIIDANSFEEELKNNKIVFFGNGAEKCQSSISNGNALFVSDFIMLADYMVDIAFNNLENNKLENVALFEPFYLKDFIAKEPKDLLKQVSKQKI